jgi:biotin transport system substrate-specific component
MAESKATNIPSVVTGRIVRGRAAVDVMLVVGASALIAIAAQVAISIPFSPVPLTLQPLAVLFVGVALGSTRGAAAAMLYLLEGFSGLPVFAQGHGGAAWFLAATAGYLYSYPFAAWLAGWLSEHGWGNRTLRSITAMLLSLGVIYLGGWSWLSIFAGPRGAFALGVAPFVAADMVKVAIGAALLPYAERLVAKTTI